MAEDCIERKTAQVILLRQAARKVYEGALLAVAGTGAASGRLAARLVLEFAEAERAGAGAEGLLRALRVLTWLGCGRQPQLESFRRGDMMDPARCEIQEDIVVSGV